MRNELKVKIQNHKLILQGCVNNAYPLPMDAKSVLLKLSDGSQLLFEHESKFDSWFLKHNKKLSDSPKYYTIERTQEYGGTDLITINYAVSFIQVSIDGTEVISYGEKEFIGDQKRVYEALLFYLAQVGFLVNDETKKDLHRIITANN